MAGFPIRYVAREVRDSGKVVAYFASPVYLFEERKRYKSDGSVEEVYEVDFVTQVYNEKFDIENSPAMKRYYKNRIYLSYSGCKKYVNLLNNKIFYDAMQNCTKSEFYALQDKHRKYCNYAEQLGHKLHDERSNDLTDGNI
ncbi:MAG: hypothetical protein IJA72_02055 [Clostridia bacterium]|nr:hypothetical protein [Clostridia bacterium]